MSEQTKIAWCDSTSNAVIGCTKISAGCKECYAAIDTPARVLRHRGIETWGDAGQRVPVKGFEKSMLAMNRRPWICDVCGPVKSGECKCIGSTGGHRRRTFCDSNSDWLDKKWPIETLAHFLDVCRRCPDMILILCTKRPENFRQRMEQAADWHFDLGSRNTTGWLQDWLKHCIAPPNIILLTSVENQAMADKRIQELLRIPAACHGLSLEPLLGPVEFNEDDNGYLRGWHVEPSMPDGEPIQVQNPNSIDWLIIGGESGQNARPCNVDWIRSLVEQGKAAGVATFVKQLGSKPCCGHSWDGEQSANCTQCFPVAIHDKKGGDPSEWTADLSIQQWPNGF